MSDFDEAIGARIANTRLGLRWSQTVLAEAVGVPRSSLSEIERGRRAVSAEEAVKFATALDEDLVWLLTGERPGKGIVDPRRVRGAARALAAVADILDDVMKGKL